MAVTGILGKKIGMTQIFDDKGDVHPITVLQAGPCVITQLKTLAKDGYDAAQIGLVEFVKSSKVNKADDRATSPSRNVPPVKLMREVAYEAPAPAAEGEEAGAAVKAGDRILVDIFSDEKICRRDRNQQGTRICGRRSPPQLRRWSQGARSHVPGAGIDRCIVVSRRVYFPGQRMPGHYGVDQVTVRNLRIRGIDLEENLLMVEGAVPGPRDGYVLISKAKAPPRERRGFAGAATVDPLKASKKASAKKK